jgi:glycosyltransferase involved in cell wall biosynthesis
MLGWIDHQVEKATYRQVDALTVITHSLRERAQELGMPAKCIQVIPVGANPDIVQPLPKLEMRRKLRLPLSEPIVLHAGLAPYDAALLGQSFVELTRLNPGVWLVLAGRELPILSDIVRQRGVDHRVIRLGFVPYGHLGEAMACADVLLLPYTARTINLHRYPNKMGDYLASGRPMVTNPTGDLGRLLEEEHVGLLAEETPAAFAAAVQRLLDNPALAEEMGSRARRLAETQLNWRTLAAELADFYQKVLNEWR